MAIRVTHLGTGTSSGVPMIAGHFGNNLSFDPRDKRRRSGLLIEWPRTQAALDLAIAAPAHLRERQATHLDDDRPVAVLMDTSPELRWSALASHIEAVDAVIFTHAHADHLMGLDDIRRFNDYLGQPAMPLYAEAETIEKIRLPFSYALASGRDRVPGRPLLEPREVSPGEPFTLADMTITPLRLMHGNLPVLGYRFELPGHPPLAYCTDVSHIPRESWPMLEGLDLLVLDCLQDSPHSTHFNRQQAMDIVAKLQPRRVRFTHIAFDFVHEPVNRELPPHVDLAYDGLVDVIDER